MYAGGALHVHLHLTSHFCIHISGHISISGHQVVIKVSDEAGGIARSQLADVWMYNSWRLRGGAGMGLPLARLYAMYFGGSLQLFPMEGHSDMAPKCPPLAVPPPGQCPSSAPAPPQGAPGGPGRLDTPMGKRPRHRAPSHRLGCLSELPPNLADLTAFFSPTRLRHRCLCHVQPSGRRQLGALPQRAHRGRRRGWLRAIGGARQCSPSDEARAGPSRRAVMRACGGRVCACTCMTHLCHVHVTAGRGQQWQYRVYYFLLVQNTKKVVCYPSHRFAPVRCGRAREKRG